MRADHNETKWHHTFDYYDDTANFLYLFPHSFLCPGKKGHVEEYPIPEGDIYEPFRDLMVGWIKEVRILPHEEFSITSFDELTLRGKYY